MALTKSDFARFELMLDKKFQPVCAEVQKLSQTVYGVNGDNGLNGDVQTLKDEQINTKVFKGKWIFGVSVLVVVLTIASNFVADLIK